MPMNYIPMSTPDIASARREMMRHIGVEYDSMLMGSSEEGEDKVIDQLEVDVDEHLDDWDFGDGPSIFDESSVEPVAVTKAQITSIASKIAAKVKKDSKEPCGNQNCQLCTWCTEAQVRGINILPRPVYSPRDSVLSKNGLMIVSHPSRTSVKSIDDIKKTVVYPNSRYYVHVNWANTTGGHEFLLFVIDNELYVVDSQANVVAGIDTAKGKYYFNSINWDNSFIARLDNKELNKDILKYNDMQYLTEWDKEKDLPYMLKHDMISKEEYDKAMNEGATDYNPAIGVRDAVTNQDHNDKEAFDPDKTKLPILGDKEESDDKKDENLLNDRMEDTPDDMENPIYEVVYPSQIPSYFNESAMKAKERNQLDDSEFGIPRLRKYPLNDEKHVRLAIQMFGHCKDPEDRKTLARNIFRRVAELNMDVKIKKGSAIYPYTPKKYLDEAASPIKIYGLETPMEDRTQKQINKEHENYLAVNTLQFYPEFAHHMKSLENLSFLDYFFPHITRGGFMAHLKGALDGAGLDSRIYDMLGFRPFYPVTQKTFAQRLGWYRPNLKPMDAQMTIIKRCAGHVNFFGNSTVTPEDEDHTMYCIALYAIVGEILFNPQFTMERLEANHIGILTDWHQRVIDYYDQLQEFKPGDHGYFKCAQHLYDLLWNVNDNPMDKDAAARNIVSFVSQMASEKERVNNTMNEDADMTSKEECLGYMMMELELDDTDYLLPKQKKYAILNPGAIRLAMDVIGKIPADEKKEYVKNLNQKYKDFGCDFSISVDHPYAQYADQTIIDHMNRFLTEGETPVDKAAVSDAGSDLADAPWYLRNDVNGNVGQNLLQNKELGPNDKPMQNPDFTRSEAVL